MFFGYLKPKSKHERYYIRKTEYVAGKSGRLRYAERRRARHLRRKGKSSEKPRATIFPRGRQDGQGHGYGQQRGRLLLYNDQFRDRRLIARKQPYQKVQAQIQYFIKGRQDLSLP